MPRIVSASLCFGLVAFMVGTFRSLPAEEAKTPAIKELMKTAHDGETSPLRKVQKQLQTDKPVWAEIEKDTKSLADLGVTLQKVKTENSKAARRYAESVAALQAAVKKQEKNAALAAFKQLKMSCAGCHYGGKP